MSLRTTLAVLTAAAAALTAAGRMTKAEHKALPTERQADEMILGRETDFNPAP